MNRDNIISWNCDGFFSHHNEFKLLLQNYNPIVCCLQETKFNVNQFPSFRNFKSYIKNYPTETVSKGGVMTLVSENYSSEHISLDTDLEAVAVRLFYPIKFTICNLYIRGRDSIQKSDLKNLIDQLSPPFMITGDINARNLLWGSDRTDFRGKFFEELINEYNLCVLNKGNNTHVSIGYRSLSAIDVTLVSPDIFPILDWFVDDDTYDSDHFPIIIPIQTQNTYENIRESWRIDKADWFKYQNALEFGRLREPPENIDLYVDVFTSIVQTAAESSIPKTTNHKLKKCVPWWNKEIEENIKTKRKLLRKFKRTLSIDDMKNYVRAKNNVRRLVREAKNKSWSNFVSSINSNASTKSAFERINKINGNRKNKQIKSLLHQGNLVTNSQEIIEVMADHFSHTSSYSNYSTEFQEYINQANSTPTNIPEGQSEIYNQEFTLDELHAALNDCKGSSPGPDNVHYCMIKNLSLTGKLHLLKIYNRIFRNGTFPRNWRKSLLVPILKPGKDPKNPENYRPISLTCCLSKVLEKMISRRLMWYLETKKVLSIYQAGFRKNRSTIDNLAYFESSIMEAFCEKKYLISVFFDIQKAYDRIWRTSVIKSMIKSGLKGNIVLFVQEFLRDRCFQVILGNTKSASRMLETGILQGSVISVTLFILTINSVFAQIEDPVKVIMYCDDLCIFTGGKNLDSIKSSLQNSLDNLKHWSTQTGFEFSNEKTVSMVFTRKYGKFDAPSLKLGTHIIQYVDSHKFLGVTWDKKLQWKLYLLDLKVRLSKNLNLLKMLSNSSFGSDRKMLLRLLNLYIFSVVDYGSILYSSASKTTLKIIEPIINTGIRISTGAFRTSPTESLFVDAGTLPLQYRREKQLLKFAIKILSNKEHPLHDNLKGNNALRLFNRKQNYCPLYVRMKKLLIKYNLDISVDNKNNYSIAPWETRKFRINTILTKYRKNNTSQLIFQKIFLETLEKYKEFKPVFTDASLMDSNTGSAFIEGDYQELFNLGDKTTIFTAELFAIFRAILHSLKFSNEKFIIFSDSLSSLQAIEKMYSKNGLVQRIYERIMTSSNYYLFFWIPSHVGIQGNETVDMLAKEAVKKAVCTTGYLHNKYDLFTVINKLVWNKWENDWKNKKEDENKLRKIKNNVKPWLYSSNLSRRETIILTRLRIGHSNITHSHLFDKIAPNLCVCGTVLSVFHIFNDCNSFVNLRNKYGLELHSLDSNDETIIRNILLFIRNIRLYNRI